MKIPDLPTLTHLMDTLRAVWPFLVTGGAVLAVALTLVAFLTRRTSQRRTRKKMSLENRLTFLVALIIAGVCAQGMGLFFYKELKFPLGLVIVVGGVLELTAFVCALRARRNVMDTNIGKAGIDGIAVWVVTALSGTFSAMEADKFEVAVFRLVMPLLAAWLWERGMSIERRKVRGGSTIHWRLTPERVLVWLRVAEPSGRTASEVDAHRRLTRVAKAATEVRSLRSAKAWESKDGKRRLAAAEKKLQKATLAAVVHANLGTDPARKNTLLSQVRFIYNSLSLAEVTPDSPWSDVDAPPAAGDLSQVTGSPSGHRALEPSGHPAPETPRATRVTDPNRVTDPSHPTPESLTQTKPLSQGTPSDLSQATAQPTTDATVQGTPAPESPEPQATPVKSPAKPQGTGTPRRRTDQELIDELEAIVADHYRENPGEEIKVKPLAARLNIGRDRARRLLDEMNVRPLRKAANQ